MNERQIVLEHDENQLLDPKGLAKELGVSVYYVWSHIREIPHVKLGRLTRFRRSDIRAYLEKLAKS